MSLSDTEQPSSDPESLVEPQNGQIDLVRVKLDPEDVSYEATKSAIYAQARYLFEKGQTIRNLLVSSDLYEILNRRLVFKTAAHRDLPHFITPYGNLNVQRMDESLDEPLSFIIDE